MNEEFKIVCPLLIMADPESDWAELTCLEESCAWYDDENECCAVLLLAQKKEREPHA